MGKCIEKRKREQVCAKSRQEEENTIGFPRDWKKKSLGQTKSVIVDSCSQTKVLLTAL